VDGRGRVNLRFFPGVSFYGEYDSVERPFDVANLNALQRDNRWLVGLTLDTDYAGGSYAALTSSRSRQEYAGSSGLGRLSRGRYRSLFAPAHTERIRLEGAPSDRQFVHLLLDLRKLGKTRGVDGVLLELNGFEVGWAKIDELRHEIARLRGQGKRV